MINSKDIEVSKNWIKSIYLLKGALDRWAIKNFENLWEGRFQPSHIQFLLCINKNGSKSSEISRECGISKQATSKIVKSLEELELITLTKDPSDQRSSQILLTEKGSNIVSESLMMFTKLIQSYNNLHKEVNLDQESTTLDLALKFIKDN